MSTFTAAGVSFSSYDSNHYVCDDCGGIVAKPDTPWGVDPSDHTCR